MVAIADGPVAASEDGYAETFACVAGPVRDGDRSCGGHEIQLLHQGEGGELTE